MKNCYMVEFELPQATAKEFLDKIPQQQQAVEMLMEQGVVKSYSLAQNRSRLWMVVSAQSEFETMRVIGRLPLSRFMIPSIAPLLSHDATVDHFLCTPPAPAVSLS